MRTESANWLHDELKRDQADDLMPVVTLLGKRKIPHVYRTHPIAEREPRIKQLIGYYPTGEHQIIVADRFSIIRGAISFGYYEVMATGKKGRWARDPERFLSPRALVDAIEHELFSDEPGAVDELPDAGGDHD